MKILYLPNLTLYDANLTEGGGGGDDGSLKGIFYIYTHYVIFIFILQKVLGNILYFYFFEACKTFIFSIYSQGG